jgi:hypothetical protein
MRARKVSRVLVESLVLLLLVVLPSLFGAMPVPTKTTPKSQKLPAHVSAASRRKLGAYLSALKE